MGMRKREDSEGERGENRDRALRKKIISPKLSKADVLLKTIEPVTDQQRHAARIAVAARAHGPDDCRWLLDALGLGAT